ncbi:hypothetical protein M2459_003163 [Parabacteroides sp. PF5-5]|uniref:family 10 glycosylhydrolase n=1 Tax=unclassified Parabacteroides TaxID=2649774 RepID=UPI0024733A20|nr:MULTISPECIES: family 10 glycosylhydrolase [unclassified Parabacteroides]MDH6306439.1 hypothetical protein [Parabacteroides sp. PH5-39]MDH6317409.1 hypothetical protein [Parabacteroides sp. PF5-13]MDH6321150.1 hypothetical protein [Parabacteroides sp. PH5-13]MDH6324882.1 hypothetical protein [Parabacteroides sp. PH5-8]MDH6328594.1 hypothetical protein [Parabacteroides sp. PH5-41]
MRNLKIVLLLLVAVGMLSCTEKKEEPVSKYPMFWTWLDYRPTMNFDSVCVVMKETGIEGVMLNAPTPDDYRKAIPIAHKHGLEVYAWLWTMNLEHDRERILKEHPEWFSVNRKGESLADTKAYVNYYKFMCPILPEVRQHIREKIKAYCEVEGLNGIAIDYHRFVDVILPTTLWPRYGIVQDREYPEWDYGYHPAMIEAFKAKHGYDPREQEDPSADDLWLQFRCDQITEVANEIAEVVHSYGKVMAASPFPTPKMSKRMVRQDWGKWNLDIVFPMVYHNFYTEDVSFISDCTIENVKDKNPNTTLYCGMMASNGPMMFDCMNEALNNGAEGIAIFTVGSLRSPEVRAQFKAYTDSVKAVRAEHKGNPVQARTTVNIDPFKNEGIMKLIQARMLKALSLENKAQPEKLDLGEYKVTDEYGTTVCYQVLDKASNVAFDVTFYFYGGIISGWDVKPENTSFEKYKL